jgi:hypothetical protein
VLIRNNQDRELVFELFKRSLQWPVPFQNVPGQPRAIGKLIVRAFHTFTVGHGIEQEHETDRRAVTFFGEQAYRTNHVGTDTATGNRSLTPMGRTTTIRVKPKEPTGIVRSWMSVVGIAIGRADIRPRTFRVACGVTAKISGLPLTEAVSRKSSIAGSIAIGRSILLPSI